jgi:hypothetical protein
MGFGGIEILFDDAGSGRIKAEQSRLQASRDQALVEPEGEIVILVGHWADAGKSTRRRPWLSHSR